MARTALTNDRKRPHGHGPKGIATRRRIMQATMTLLAARPFTDLHITEIARAAEIAQPNFYNYFSSVEDVILEIAEGISLDHLVEFIERDWEGEAGVGHARELIEAAVVFWQDYGQVFAITGLLADRSHGQFTTVRVRQMRLTYKAFEAKARAAQAAGRHAPEVTPRLVGYEALGLVASICMKYDLHLRSGFSHDQLVRTNARLLHLLVTGAPPAPAR